MAPYVKILAVVAAVLLLASCGDPTKEEILKKVDGIDTKQELEKVLGLPGDISKLGPIETWTYTAVNGTVSFLIAGDKVTLSATGDKKPASQ
ncbi:MAG: hypothetical protein EXR11_07655 [Rhodospirillaceae bacterium]|nr:hypothetical protein [Rhodospirillaceae bacterium]